MQQLEEEIISKRHRANPLVLDAFVSIYARKLELKDQSYLYLERLFDALQWLNFEQRQILLIRYYAADSEQLRRVKTCFLDYISYLKKKNAKSEEFQDRLSEEMEHFLVEAILKQKNANTSLWKEGLKQWLDATNYPQFMGRMLEKFRCIELECYEFLKF